MHFYNQRDICVPIRLIYDARVRSRGNSLRLLSSITSIDLKFSAGNLNEAWRYINAGVGMGDFIVIMEPHSLLILSFEFFNNKCCCCWLARNCVCLCTNAKLMPSAERKTRTFFFFF